MAPIKLALFALALLIAPPLQAAEPLKLDLAAAVERALTANMGLAASAERITASDARKRAAVGAMLPRLDAGMNVSRSDSPITAFGSKLLQQRFTQQDFDPARLNQPDAVTNYQTTLRLTLPVYQGGALWAEKQRSEHAIEATTSEHASMRQQLIFDVIAAYARVQRAEAMLRANRQAELAASTHLATTEALHRRGLNLDSDVLAAKVHLLDTSVEKRQATDERDNAFDALRVLLNLEQGMPVQVGDDGQLRAPGRTLEQWQEHALSQRPDIKALQSRLDAARAGVGIARAGFRPHVSLMAQEEWNNDALALKHRFATVGGLVQINAFAGGADRAKVEAAQAQVARLDYSLREQYQRIRAEVAAAWRGMKESEARLQARQTAVQQTAEALRILTLRHKSGLEKTVDVLAAQAQLDRARAHRIRASFDAVLARAHLYLAAGSLSPEVLE